MTRARRALSLPDLADTMQYEHIECADGVNLTPTERAALFMKHEGSKFHPAFAATEVAAKAREAATKGAIFTPDTRWYTEKFLESIKIYQDAVSDPAIRAIEIRSQHSWEEVLRLAREAITAYEQKGDNRLGKTARAFSDITDAGLPFFRLIPQELFLEVLAGALRLVFEAASRFGEVRRKAIYVIAQVPMLLHETEASTAIFRDVDLYARAEKLYVAALTAIEGVMKWLSEGKWTKQLKALTQGPTYGRSLVSKIDDLGDCMRLLRERAMVLTHESVNRIERTVTRTEKAVENTAATVKSTSGSVQSTEQTLRNTDRTVRDTEDKVNCMHNALDEMVKVLADRNLTSEWMNTKEKEIRKLYSRIRTLEKTAATLTPEEVLELLDAGSNTHELDLDYVLRRECTAMDEATQAALTTINCSSFMNWQSSAASAALFIQGATPTSSRRITPTSIISSRTIESLRGLRDHAVPIYFYCNAHAQRSDSLRGPQGLVRSLLTQLLQELKFDLSVTPLRRAREQLQSRQLRFLCELFVALIQQLPADATIFCIVDGIRDFELKEWKEDCVKVVTMLRDLVDDDRVEATFKLLVLSPTRTKYVAQDFPRGERLSLLDPEDGRRSTISAREMTGRVRRPKTLKNDPIYNGFRSHQEARSVSDSDSSSLSTDSERGDL